MKLKKVTNYCQQDKDWKNILLGENTSYYTIGLFGCLLTDIVDYLNALGHKETPATFNEKAIKAGCFEPKSGLWRWGTLQNVYSDIKLKYISPEYRGVKTPQSFFDDLRKHIDDGYWCLLEVDFDPIKTGEQMHWLSAIGYNDTTKMPIVLDPWTGTEVELSIYGDPQQSCFQFYCYDQKVPFFTPEDPCKDLKEKLAETEKTLEGVRKSRDEWKDKYNDIKETPKQLEAAKALLEQAENNYNNLNDRYTKAVTELTATEKKLDIAESQITSKDTTIKDLKSKLEGKYDFNFLIEVLMYLFKKKKTDDAQPADTNGGISQ